MSIIPKYLRHVLTVILIAIRNRVTTVTIDEAPKLPDMYMDPHLKGRLVLKFGSFGPTC